MIPESGAHPYFLFIFFFPCIYAIWLLLEKQIQISQTNHPEQQNPIEEIISAHDGTRFMMTLNAAFITTEIFNKKKANEKAP